jgi:hypothetical protein
MSSGAPLLGVAMRFRPQSSAELWGRIVTAILAWEPRIQPTHVERLTDPDGQVVRWSPATLEELGRRCAQADNFAWLLFPKKARELGIYVSSSDREVHIDLLISNIQNRRLTSLLCCRPYCIHFGGHSCRRSSCCLIPR